MSVREIALRRALACSAFRAILILIPPQNLKVFPQKCAAQRSGAHQDRE